MRVTKIELTNRLNHIEKLFKQGKNIRSDSKVKKWSLSPKQLKRYIEIVINRNRGLKELLKDDKIKVTYRIPKKLNKKLKEYSKTENQTQQRIVIEALYQFLQDKGKTDKS